MQTRRPGSAQAGSRTVRELDLPPDLALRLLMMATCPGGLFSNYLTSLAIEHVIRQEGTAIYVAVVLLARTTASLPLLVNTLVALALGMLIVVAARRFKLDS